MPRHQPHPPVQHRPVWFLRGWALGACLLLAVPAPAAEREEPRRGQAGGGAVLAAIVPTPEPARPEEPGSLPETRLTRGAIRRGDTLASSFQREGVPRSLAFQIARLMSHAYDFRTRSREGHQWELARGKADEGWIDFRYRVAGLENYHLFRDPEGKPVVRKESGEMVERLARLDGVVETTLYDAVKERGEDPQLARDFADVFAWDVDFSRSVRAGDEFRVLYEQLYRVEEDGSEVYVGPGPILAARYRGDETHVAVYFETEAGRGGYYRPDGTSVRGRFLKAPLRFARISSEYSQSRMHPILKVKRPHQGIDYAAPHGEPVWSVADGKVLYRGWAGGFGNLVKVRHKDGFVSYYAHLSRFARGMQVGDRVQQKQVIGYVGRTGLATGPHVCFRIAKDGRFVNPADLRLPAGEPVPAVVRDVFASNRDLLLAELEAGPLLASDTRP